MPLDTVLAESDDVQREIVGAGSKRTCDLICMGSHGRRGLAGVLLGSEPHKVLVHGAIPVLVLRRPRCTRFRNHCDRAVFHSPRACSSAFA